MEGWQKWVPGRVLGSWWQQGGEAGASGARPSWSSSEVHERARALPTRPIMVQRLWMSRLLRHRKAQLLLVNLLTFGLEVCLAAGITYVPPLLLEVGVEEKFMTMVLGESHILPPSCPRYKPPGKQRDSASAHRAAWRERWLPAVPEPGGETANPGLRGCMSRLKSTGMFPGPLCTLAPAWCLAHHRCWSSFPL